MPHFTLPTSDGGPESEVNARRTISQYADTFLELEAWRSRLSLFESFHENVASFKHNWDYHKLRTGQTHTSCICLSELSWCLWQKRSQEHALDAFSFKTQVVVKTNSLTRVWIKYTVVWIKYTVVPPYLQFCFLWFQLPTVNCSPKILNSKLQK